MHLEDSLSFGLNRQEGYLAFRARRAGQVCSVRPYVEQGMGASHLMAYAMQSLRPDLIPLLIIATWESKGSCMSVDALRAFLKKYAQEHEEFRNSDAKPNTASKTPVPAKWMKAQLAKLDTDATRVKFLRDVSDAFKAESDKLGLSVMPEVNQ